MPAISASERSGLFDGKNSGGAVLFFAFASQSWSTGTAVASGTGAPRACDAQAESETKKQKMISMAKVFGEIRLQPYARKIRIHPRVTSVGPNGRSKRTEP